MAKIERKFMAHYIDASVPEDQDSLFERLGLDLEEFSPELSAQVTKKRNILGETEIVISGYEKTAEVGTYYANPDTELYGRLQDIIEKAQVMDTLGTRVVDVYLWKDKQEYGYPAVLEYAYIEVKSYGGDTTGYQIPFTIHYTGRREHGYFDVESRCFTSDQQIEQMG